MKHLSPPMPAFCRMLPFLCVLATGMVAGCGGPVAGWSISYEDAEQAAAANNCDLFVLYRDHLDTGSGAVIDILNDPRVRPLLNGKVKCSLVTEYEPNRRFVAQYGVEGAPALIVIHPDRTYHALERIQSVEQMVSFLENARPPGKKPQLNPQVPRRYTYRWEGIYEEAVEQAKRRNRELLIVYKWWLSAESTELLRRMSRPEVARHFTDMVHCLLDWDYVPNRGHMAKYGVRKVPAIVIVHRDGTYHAKTGLCGIEELVRFVVSARPPGLLPLPAGRHDGWRARAASPSSYRWYADFASASVLASRQRRDLLLFYHSVFSDGSTRMDQLLNRSEVADLFAGMVHCKLDWATQGNRELMARYGVDRVPALVIVRPDGTYHSQVGSAGLAELVALVRAAGHRGAVPVPPGGAG